MVRGVMLIKAAYAASLDICREASNIPGVMDAYPVFGRFDVVVFIEGKELQDLKETALKVVALKGIKSTETLIEGA